MVNSVRFFVFLFLLSSCASLSQKEPQDVEAHLKKQIDKILRYDIEWNKKDTPGFLVHVVEPDTTFTVNYGTEVGSEEKMDVDRNFGIGGLSKVYSSVAVSHAIWEGEIDTTEFAHMIFDEFNEENGSFTILDLMRHTAGFPRMMKKLNVSRKNEYEEVEENEFLASLADQKWKSDPDFRYNHSDFVLMELWVRRKTGLTVQDWYKKASEKYVQLPAWKSTAIDVEGLTKKGKVRQGIDYGIYESSLGLYANRRDLEAMARFLLSDNEISKFILDTKVKTGISKTVFFSNGLYRIQQNEKHRIYGHGGRSLMNSASIHFVPENNKALVILSNSATGTKQLYLPILSMINNNWN